MSTDSTSRGGNPSDDDKRQIETRKEMSPKSECASINSGLLADIGQQLSPRQFSILASFVCPVMVLSVLLSVSMRNPTRDFVIHHILTSFLILGTAYPRWRIPFLCGLFSQCYRMSLWKRTLTGRLLSGKCSSQFIHNVYVHNPQV